MWLMLTFIILGSELYDWLSVGEFLTHTFHIYRGITVYPSPHVCELLTQRKYGHASSTVFYYDTRNKTFTNKVAQNRQCSIQPLSVEFAVEV